MTVTICYCSQTTQNGIFELTEHSVCITEKFLLSKQVEYTLYTKADETIQKGGYHMLAIALTNVN